MYVATSRLLISLLPFALAAGCARVPEAIPQIVKPYRITVQQGNYVTRDMVEQLKPGMTREQVRYVLGTPLLTDIFHADRWDYVFFREPPGGKREQRNFSVIFEDGKLARVVGDLLPSEPVQPAVKPAPVAMPEPKPEAKPVPKAEAKQDPKPEAKEEAKAEARAEDKPARGFFGRMLERIGF